MILSEMHFKYSSNVHPRSTLHILIKQICFPAYHLHTSVFKGSSEGFMHVKILQLEVC